MKLRLGCLCLFVSTLGGLGQARAQRDDGDEAPTPSLSWVRLPGAEECVSVTQLGNAVEAQLGHATFASPTSASLFIEGWIARVGDDAPLFRASLVLHDVNGEFIGERFLETEPGADCETLVPALVLAIVITIDPEAALIEEVPSATSNQEVEDDIINELASIDVPPEPEPPALPERASTPTETRETNETEAEEAEESLHVALLGEFIVGLETLPGVPLGAVVNVTIDLPHFPPFELAVGSFIGATAEHGDAKARFDQVFGRLTVCVPWQLDFVGFHVCGGIEGGVTFIRGSGIDLPTDEVRPIFNFVAGFNVVFRPVSRLLLRLGVTAVVPIFHDRIVYSDAMSQDQELFEVGAFGGMFDLGIGVEL